MSECRVSNSHQQTEPEESDKRVREHLKRIQNKLLVMSGKGGVGKSSVAAYISLGLSKLGFKVGLLDVDLHGPSIPGIMGVSGMFTMDEESKCMVPRAYNDKLGVVSIQCLLDDRDSAVIWRGPVKHGVIKQFIAEVAWGDLDFLVIDSPPGTGDEPLSVAQTIPDAHAIIVTTPQEVALADVRKSINFCRKVQMPILGLVENMSGLICPHCDKEIDLFSKGGGLKTAAEMSVPFLGSLPFEPRVVEAGDRGISLLEKPDGSRFLKSLNQLLTEVVDRCAMSTAKAADDTKATESSISARGEKTMQNHTFKVAVPLAGGRLTNHFGHCEQFAILNVQNGEIRDRQVHTPPVHEPGVLPRWLGEMQVDLIIAGGMGSRALQLFDQQNIKVVTGAPNLTPEELVQNYVSGKLVTGGNVCDH